MNGVLEKVEKTVDDLIVPCLFIVLFIVIVGLFFQDFYTEHKKALIIIDDVVIGIFIADLAFKIYRSTDWEGFLKEHWLEVIAVMPAFLVYRIIEGIFIAVEYVEKSQHIAHLLEGARSGRFAAFIGGGGLTRSERLAKFIRPLSRSTRLAKAVRFYESPKHKSVFSPDESL